MALRIRLAVWNSNQIRYLSECERMLKRNHWMCDAIRGLISDSLQVQCHASSLIAYLISTPSETFMFEFVCTSYQPEKKYYFHWQQKKRERKNVDCVFHFLPLIGVPRRTEMCVKDKHTKKIWKNSTHQLFCSLGLQWMQWAWKSAKHDGCSRSALFRTCVSGRSRHECATKWEKICQIENNRNVRRTQSHAEVHWGTYFRAALSSWSRLRWKYDRSSSRRARLRLGMINRGSASLLRTHRINSAFSAICPENQFGWDLRFPAIRCGSSVESDGSRWEEQKTL